LIEFIGGLLRPTVTDKRRLPPRVTPDHGPCASDLRVINGFQKKRLKGTLLLLLLVFFMN
jgi:hypothetical protein